MATNFPNSLDNLTNPSTSSQLNSPSHAAQHTNANDAIEALQAKVGVDGSAVATSHDYKIAQLQAAVSAGVSGTKLIYQDVRNQSGSNLSIATPVYVTGSEGASGKLLISAASNASEATSSKTMGLTSSSITNNNNGQVVTEGILENIDTTGAADGDPVWLGVNGAKIYGLANKPSAPAHLVFLGIVVRGGQANTGSIYVKIQNGFELQELHNVSLEANGSITDNEILAYDTTSGLWKNQTKSEAGFATVASSGSYNDLSNLPTLTTNLNSLSDVTITGTPTNQQLIVYDTATGQWENKDPIASTGIAYKAGYPASKTSTGIVGQIAIDGANGTLYVCTSTDTWQKVSLNGANFTNAGGFA